MFNQFCYPCASLNANSIQSTHGFTELVDPQHPQQFLERETIETLLQFSRISHLKLDFFLSTERVTIMLINEMISSWPGLRELDLATAYNTYSSSAIDTEGLCAFTRCRYLESLAIPIDASRLDEFVFRNRPGNGIRCLTLKSLYVGQSAIRNPRAVAAVISDIFPNLLPRGLGSGARVVRPRAADHTLTEQEDLWSECRTHLYWFAEIRKQERTWSSHTEPKD